MYSAKAYSKEMTKNSLKQLSTSSAYDAPLKKAVIGEVGNQIIIH